MQLAGIPVYTDQAGLLAMCRLSSPVHVGTIAPVLTQQSTLQPDINQTCAQ